MVHLGALRNPHDVGYSYGHDSFSVSINSKSALSAQIKIKNPESWADFTLLFNRLIAGYVPFFPEFHKKFLTYLERLQQYVDFKIASPTAMIEYDRRVRTTNHKFASFCLLSFSAISRKPRPLLSRRFPLSLAAVRISVETG